jgi:hypothetical protein
MHPKPEREGVRWAPFDTLRADLRQPESVLLGQLDQTTRYEVRRAEDRDGLKDEYWHQPSPKVILEFLTFYDQTRHPGRGTGPKPQTLAAYAQAGCLQLSRALDGTGIALVWHAYLVESDIGLLLHSSSGFRGVASAEGRQLHSRANRWLHWRDMQRFRESDLGAYDWGGYYAGRENAGLERVNAFKRGFGGELVRAWDGQAGATLRGKAYLLLRYTQHRHLQRSMRAGPQGPVGPRDS